MPTLSHADTAIESAPEQSGGLFHIMEHAPSVIYVYNQVTHSNEYSNRDIGEMLGYSAEEVLAMGAELMPTLVHPDDLPRVFEHLSKIRLLKDGVIGSLEYRMKHKNGHWVWLLSRDTVFRRSDVGEVTHHIGSAVDISAQKQAEASLIASETKAQATNQELRDFAYAISHDMKAPSNTLKLLLSEMEVSLGNGDVADLQELMSLGHSTIDRMQNLIDDVLSHTQVIGQETVHEVVDLNAVFETVQAFLKADISATLARIDMIKLPLVWGAQPQLVILFQNLVQNAMKFARNDVSPIVTIDATPNLAGDKVTVSVTDNGIGIPHARQQQIFQLFKKLNADEKFTGSGIGLATCRRIAFNHKTEIALTSKTGEGSTFSIELSLA